MKQSNNRGILLLELLFSLSLIVLTSSAIILTLLQLFSTSRIITSELYHQHSLSFIHDVFEDDLVAPLSIHQITNNTLSITNSSDTLIDYTLSRGRIGRSENGSRRTFFSPSNFLQSFTGDIEHGVLEITLNTVNGNHYELWYATE